MTQGSFRTRPLRRIEYDRLISEGLIGPGDPLELLGGALMVAEPQGSAHFTTILLVEEALRAAFGHGWHTRVQGPLALDDDSEPEPDLAVVRGTPRDYRDGHPARPALVVEVAESSLALDREIKGSLYARARLLDYWIVNLVDRVVEVLRDPRPDAAAAHGWRYGSVAVIDVQGSVEPLVLPGTRIPVADLLP
jgi:Uma2 family endonuclease